MSSVTWDPKARDFLRKLPKHIADRIFQKVDTKIKKDVKRHLEALSNRKDHKIRIGDYRLFVEYLEDKDHLIIRTIRHRKDAYKKQQ